MAQLRLAGKTALITGAAKRIGRAVAIALAEEGVNLVIHYSRSVEEAVALRAEAELHQVKAWLVKAELENPEECETLITQSLELAGSLDIVINNASVFRPNTLGDMDFGDVVNQLRVNAWAPFVLGREFARLGGRGHVVNLLDSRIAGYDFAHTAYILSKHTLAVLTRMMALEFAPGIAVNAVAPGLILPPPGKDSSYLDRLAAQLPLERHGNPGDIVHAVLYLLKSDFVTGEVLYVDGGRHLREGSDGPDSHP